MIQSIREMVERASTVANSYWRFTEPKERVERLRRLRLVIKARVDEIVSVLYEECGKPAVEALGDEIAITLSLLNFWIEHAEEVIVEKVPQKPSAKLMLPGNETIKIHTPLGSGIVNVISPWNNPFQLAMTDVVEVLVSGNVCILKPSPKTPRVNNVIREIIKDAELEDVFYLTEGDGEVAKQIMILLPKKSHVTFTGSSKIGDLVRKTCHQYDLYPHIEGSGSDTVVILLGPDSAEKRIRRAVNAIVSARFRNRGENCNAGKNVLVVTSDENWAHEFARRVARRALELKPGTDMGNVFDEDQLKLAQAQLQDALDKNADCLTHNAAEALSATRYFPPVVLWNVKRDMRVFKEETFCPILVVRHVWNLQEVIEELNGARYGLNLYIFGENDKENRWLARRLHRVGSICINNVQVNFAFVGLPFGDPREGNLSFRHGVEGVLRYTYPKSIVVSHKMPEVENHWPPYDSHVNPLPLRGVMKMLARGSRKEDALRFAIKKLL